MAGLCWMAVTLGLLLSVGNSSAEPSLSKLKYIVDQLWNTYRPTYEDNTGGRRYPMFSLAANIPFNDNKEDIYGFSQVIKDDPPVEVKKSMLRCEVYEGKRVVAATVLKWPDVLDQCPHEEVQWSIVKKNCKKKKMTWADMKTGCPDVVCISDHAEFRVLQNFDTLKKQNKNDLLLFYVLASPCDEKCTKEGHESSILEKIKKIKKWDNYAYVFTDLFNTRDGKISDENRKGALERLGESIPLTNIYRVTADQCSRCSISGKADVNPFCYKDPGESDPSDNKPSASASGGRSDPSSPSGQGEKDKKNNKMNQNAGVSTRVGGNSGGVVGQAGSGGSDGGWKR